MQDAYSTEETARVTSAAKEYGWNLQLDEIASLQRTGCIQPGCE
jgi:6-phosphogluconate dehydrogenase